MYATGRGPRGRRPARRAVRYLQVLSLSTGPRSHHFVVALNGHLFTQGNSPRHA